MLAQYKPVFPTLNELSTYNGKKAYVPLSFVNDNGEEANKTEFLQLIFYIPASLLLYNATRPEIRNIFKKR